MDELKDKIGTVVKNDGKELAAALDVYNLTHTGNFCFEASFGGMSIVITTEPQDDNGDVIRVTDIRIHPDVIRRIGITYHMTRARELAETYVELPISQAQFERVEKWMQHENESDLTITPVKEILERLTKLQGYDKLGSYSIELGDYDGRIGK